MNLSKWCAYSLAMNSKVSNFCAITLASQNGVKHIHDPTCIINGIIKATDTGLLAKWTH